MNLRKIMQERKLSVPKLVESSGVPRRTIQGILKSGNTTVDTAIRLADALEVTLDELCRSENRLKIYNKAIPFDISCCRAEKRVEAFAIFGLQAASQTGNGYKRRTEMEISGYKASFIELMVKSGVLLFGDFKTKSGRQSPYFVNTGLFRTGAQADMLSEYYADAINDKLAGSFDALFGPAYKGIPLCSLTAAALWRLYEIDAGYCFNRKEVKDHGEGGVFVGWKPKDGDRILIIEDVITAGTAIREVIPILKSAADVKVTDMMISVNRMEKGYNGKTAIEEIKEEFGITVHSIVNTLDILNYLYNREIDGVVYIDDEIKERMEKYIEMYCIIDEGAN